MDKNNKTEEQFLKETDYSKYKNPSITVDNLVFAIDEEENDNIRKLNEQKLKILLIKRKEHPYMNTWTLPGVFLGFDESLEKASIRCLKEKAKLNNIYLEQLYTFADTKRDPRTRVISIAYMGLINNKNIKIKEQSVDIAWFTLKVVSKSNDIYELILKNDENVTIKTKIEYKNDNITVLEKSDLGFDHANIIFYGLLRMRNKVEYTDIAFSLLEDKFTMAELQQVYEVILDKKLTKANFQRKIKDRVEPLNEYKTGGYRPALLYKYKK